MKRLSDEVIQAIINDPELKMLHAKRVEIHSRAGRDSELINTINSLTRIRTQEVINSNSPVVLPKEQEIKFLLADMLSKSRTVLVSSNYDDYEKLLKEYTQKISVLTSGTK